METGVEKIIAPCSSCISETRHNVLYSMKRHDDEDTNDWYGLIECAGCSAVSMVHQSRYLGDGSVTATYYPFLC